MEKIRKTAAWPDNLLITKLNIPSPHFKVVRRQRLVDLINPEMKIPLITVVAPAGYGKTTLIVDSLDNANQSGWKVVWLSLDPLDNSLIRFWSYIAAGITREAKIKISTEPFIQHDKNAPFPEVIHPIIHPIINSVADTNKPILLVLDDYHVINDDAIHQSLLYLINHQPENLHILISSRKSIPFSLFKQKTECKLVEITAEQLAFTLPETNLFFTGTMDLDLNQEQVKSLYQLTEGWIVALQLVAISIHGKSDLENLPKLFSSSKQQLSEYLFNDVFEHQDSAVRDFLLKTSIFSEISASFCNAVLDRKDSEQMLLAIKEANLFVLSVDNQHVWFRYHPLFAQVLKDRLGKSDPECIPALFKRAYIWLKDNGYPYKAVAYAISAGDTEIAAEIIETCALQAIIQTDTNSLVGWINQISPEILTNRPTLMLYSGLAYMLLGEISKAILELEKLEKILSENPNLTMNSRTRENFLWKITAIRTVISSLKGNYKKEIKSIQDLMEAAPDVEPYFIGFLTNSLSEAYGLAEEYDLTAASFLRTMEFSRTNGLFDEYVNASCELGRIYAIQGKIFSGMDLLSGMLDEALQEEANSETILLLKSGLMECHLIQNDLGEAQKFAHELSQAYKEEYVHGFPWIYQSNILLRLAEYYITVGDFEQAEQYVVRVNQRMQGDRWYGNKQIGGYIYLQTEIWMHEKKFNLAENWLKDRIKDNDGWAIHSTDEKIMLAKVYLAQNKPRSAIPLLTEMEGYLSGKEMIYLLIDDLVTLSIAQRMNNANGKSLSAIQKAVELAEPERIFHPFIKAGPALRDVLVDLAEYDMTDLVEKADSREFIAEILGFMNPKKKTSSRFMEETPRKYLLQHILTDREVEIFEKLLRGESEKDIALDYMISVNTVKAHVRNIYKKLNIHNRREAHQWLYGLDGRKTGTGVDL